MTPDMEAARSRDHELQLWKWTCGLLLVVVLLLVALLIASCAQEPREVSSPALSSAVAPALRAVTQDRHHGGNGR